MHGGASDLGEIRLLARLHPAPSVDLLICPPATLIAQAAREAQGSCVSIGGQDCHADASGAHTGDISAPMLADAGAGAVILGHSERRADHGETDMCVRAKVDAAQAAGLQAIVCVGETLDQRNAEATLDVVGAQLAGSLPDACTARNTVVAYEPVWAIGTGKVAGCNDIAQVHSALRAQLVARFGPVEGGAMTLLYGGSVKASNAAEIFATPEVNGALVGGASLKAADFAPIVTALGSASVG